MTLPPRPSSHRRAVPRPNGVSSPLPGRPRPTSRGPRDAHRRRATSGRLSAGAGPKARLGPPDRFGCAPRAVARPWGLLRRSIRAPGREEKPSSGWWTQVAEARPPPVQIRYPEPKTTTRPPPDANAEAADLVDADRLPLPAGQLLLGGAHELAPGERDRAGVCGFVETDDHREGEDDGERIGRDRVVLSSTTSEGKREAHRTMIPPGWDGVDSPALRARGSGRSA